MYEMKLAAGCAVETNQLRTVEENIDIKIASCEKEIERLKASKIALAPLLGMRIRDIREAMSY